MKVRLKQFKFHCLNVQSMFQFHEGPIKTRVTAVHVVNEHCFNSMKVRLKQGGYTKDRKVMRFQFHEGPIKTVALTEHRVHVVVSIP